MNISKTLNVLVISHGYRLASGGPAQDIRDFLKDKVDRLDYIDHPFPHADYRETHLFFYRQGLLESTQKTIPYLHIEFFRYIQQSFVNFFFLIFNSKRYDICFALDNHSVLSTILFRKLNRIGKLVYYSIDYVPQRFRNSLMNYIYHLADRLACRMSDVNWVVAKHMIQARANEGLDLKKLSPFLEVPMGFHRKDAKVQPPSKIDRFHLVYMGTLLEKQGVQLTIESLPRILKKFPKAHLTIIGTGEYEGALKNLVQRSRLENSVEFAGFIESIPKLYKILTHAGVGLAPYKPMPNSFSYYADPSKIKIYLGCGLPVITTKVTVFSRTLEREHAGIVIDYHKDYFCAAVGKFFGNKNTYFSYRKAAISFSLNYDTDQILKKAIERL